MSNGTDDTEPPIAGQLRSAGLRATRARIAIGEALTEADAPMGLADLATLLEHQQLPRSTVFRAVSELTTAGILNRYEFEEGFARYEIANGARGHHHHFICRECRGVLDLDGLGELERHMGRAEASIETTHGHVVEGHRLDLFGLCSRCASDAKKAQDRNAGRNSDKRGNRQ
ncbi:MAG: hypothetical protein DCC49_03345 [Acidobacteria bacterium]|nr:MAG: hypothetical protein DCC49_03345 [Acidobacteriota bacterium]